MKIVIDIPEEDIEYIKENEDLCDVKLQHNLIYAVIGGTPLPKGHGRLIDENNLWFEDIDDISCVTQRNVENAPTIIESDKARKEQTE